MTIYRVELYDAQGLVEARGGLTTLAQLADAVKCVQRTAEATPNLHVVRVYSGEWILATCQQQSDREWRTLPCTT